MSGRRDAELGLAGRAPDRDGHLWRPPIPVLVFVCAGMLRFWRIDAHSLWHDEAFSVLAARRSLPEMMQWLREDSAQPLYHVLLHGWIACFGDTEASVVALSALTGLALVGLVYHAGAVVFSRHAGFWAALLTALSPIHLFYSRQARMYGLLALLGLGAMLMLVTALERNRWRDWIGYAALVYAAMLTHIYGFFLPAVAGILLWMERPSGTVIKRAVLSHLGIGAAYVWWIPSLWPQITETHTPHLTPPAVLDVARTLYYFSFGQPISVSATPHPIRWALSLICAGLMLAGLWASRRRPVWGVYLFAPLCLGYAVSHIAPVYFPGRYDMLVFPAWVMLVAAGIASFRTWRVRMMAGLLTVGLTLWPLSVYLQGIARERARYDVADLIAEASREGDMVICTGLSRPTVEYGLMRRRVPVTLTSYPSEMERHMAWIDPERLLADPDRLVRDAEAVWTRIERTLPSGGRVWLVYSHPEISDVLKQRLDARMRMTVISGERYPVFAYRQR